MNATKKTSESEREICAQPPPTCPMIDEAQGVVEKCADLLRGYERMDEDEMRRALSDIESELAELTPLRRSFGSRHLGLLEKIRENAADIRNWGQGWKDHALALEEKNEDFPQSIGKSVDLRDCAE